MIAYGKTKAALPSLKRAVIGESPVELIAAIEKVSARDIEIKPHYKDLRYRHLVKKGEHFYILFNEGVSTVTVTAEVQPPSGKSWIDPFKGEETTITGVPKVTLKPRTLMVMRVIPDEQADELLEMIEK